MSKYPWKTMLAVSALVAATTYAFAQMPSGGPAGTPPAQMPDNGMTAHMHEMMQDGGMMSRMHQMMQAQGSMHDGMSGAMGMHGGMQSAAPGTPTMPGQDAFGAIQEIVQILESDPKTDWSKVNIEALRQHLIDMNEVTLRAVAVQRDLDNGIEIAVTGEGRTAEAIKRMVPAHVSELREIGWNAKSEDVPNGVKLTVLASEAQPLTKLKALGFMGIMVQGSHHQRHHLMMALGQFTH
jgi:hypothetical protein